MNQANISDDFFEGKTPLSEIVTYKFYKGLYYFREENYNEAIYCFTYAYENCYKLAVENIRNILTYLIPLRLLLSV